MNLEEAIGWNNSLLTQRLAIEEELQSAAPSVQVNSNQVVFTEDRAVRASLTVMLQVSLVRETPRVLITSEQCAERVTRVVELRISSSHSDHLDTTMKYNRGVDIW